MSALDDYYDRARKDEERRQKEEYIRLKKKFINLSLEERIEELIEIYARKESHYDGTTISLKEL